MKKDSFVLKGNICYSENTMQLNTMADGYLVCIDGVSQGAFSELPAEYAQLPITDYGNKLIVPGLVDLHLHAPQYAYRGLAMDMELLEWLNTVTFLEEAKYADLAYAEKAYRLFADAMKQGATTRACIFATLHRESTELLMDLMEKTGLRTMVGKVNMDRNAPKDLCEESAAASAQDTVQWLEDIKGRYQNTKPIITPRFIPSCTDELMEALSQIRKEYDLPIQSHLSENKSEIEWVKELCPQAAGYADAYLQTQMFGGNYPAIMAHCVYLTEDEEQLMLDHNVFVAHCPLSNINLASGIAPIRRYLSKGMKVGLGTDVAGGYSDSIFRAMADSIQVSKLRWRLMDDTLKPLTMEEAFYMGTKGGGAFFGKVGSFENGYEFDAIVIDDQKLKSPNEITIKQRLERVIYMSEQCHIDGKYVKGNKTGGA